MNPLLFILALLALPGNAVAAGTPFFTGGSSILVATSSQANTYAGGGTIAVTAPIKGDLTAAAGSLIVDAPISGDALLLGGSLRLASPVAGDARLLGGTIIVNESVLGDLVAIGGSVIDAAHNDGSVTIVAGDAKILKGADGDVKIFGNTVSLGGTFAHDVDVIAGGRITLAPGTIIRGALRYQAPQEAIIPSTATIVGGVTYTGASYLPTNEEARAIAFASFGVFLFVKILGALILAGLVAGLFPSLAESIVAHATSISVRRVLLTLLLGFGLVVTTPVLLVLLSITFVGLGLAFILGLIYLLLIPLAFIYASIVCGAYLAHRLFKRTELRWSDAVLGMLVLFLLWSLPYVGWFITVLAITYMVGVLTHLIYRFAFPRDIE